MFVEAICCTLGNGRVCCDVSYYTPGTSLVEMGYVWRTLEVCTLLATSVQNQPQAAINPRKHKK